MADTGRWMGLGGSVIGSIIGSYFGGPAGGKAGGQIGNIEGSKFGDVIDKKRPVWEAFVPAPMLQQMNAPQPAQDTGSGGKGGGKGASSSGGSSGGGGSSKGTYFR